MKAVLLKTEDLKALYINGELEEQGLYLGEPYEQELYLLRIAEKYKFNSSDVSIVTIKREDEPYIVEHNFFPYNINLLINNYEVKRQ